MKKRLVPPDVVSPATQEIPGQGNLEPYVPPEVVAAHLSIERRQVLDGTRAGKIPAHPVDPSAKRKTWRYKLSEVDAVISGSRKPSGSVRVAGNASSLHNDGGSPRSRRG